MSFKYFITALILATFAIPAHAQLSETSVEAQIMALQAQIVELQAKVNSLLGTGTGNSEQSPVSITTSGTNKNKLQINYQLRKGASGEDVKVLQEILASDPTIYPEGLVTGFFGPLTESAVKRFQAKIKVEQVGEVGPQTLARINEILSAAGITGDVPGDLLNSRVKIEVKIKDGKEEIKIEIKCDSSGSGNSCNNDDSDEDEDDDDEDEDDSEDEDDDDDDED